MAKITVVLDVDEARLKEAACSSMGIDEAEYSFEDAVNSELGWLEQSGMSVKSINMGEMKAKSPTEKLIDAVADYAAENSWTDNDFIDSLVDMGVTKEDFIRCGKGEFVEEYFKSEEKVSDVLHSDLALKFCEQLRETCGELEQLEVTITCLEGLMGWCEACFNNEQEEKDYQLLKQAHELLLKVHDSYNKNYNEPLREAPSLESVIQSCENVSKNSDARTVEAGNIDKER